eukprot:9479633-Pyramimonas_sp.AAC.2
MGGGRNVRARPLGTCVDRLQEHEASEGNEEGRRRRSIVGGGPFCIEGRDIRSDRHINTPKTTALTASTNAWTSKGMPAHPEDAPRAETRGGGEHTF